MHKDMNIYLKTFGCQMNVYDSETLVSMFLSSGDYQITESLEDANIIIVNTCSVREHAENRAKSFIGKLQKLKIKDKRIKIIVIGCFAQRAKDELKEKFPFIDIIIGPIEYEYLPEILKSEFGIGTTNFYTNFSNKVSAFVPIMTGCNNYCSYCIVPYVRGREKSRNINDILNEIKTLLENNVKEITLLGQNVNSYFSEYVDTSTNQILILKFSDVLEKVANINKTKKFWVRFLTNHPKDMTLDIIEVIKKHPNISRHIHLPLQSGSNRILKLMNRNYTVEKYIDLVKNIRKELPDISITTDLIVGFPTEKESDFQDTLNAVKEIQFDAAFVFKYSPRKGTKAYELKDDVSKEEKEKRHFELLKLCEQIANKINKNYINSNLEVLITTKNGINKFIGKTLNNKTVEIKNNKNIVGEFLKVKIVDIKTYTLIGEISQ